MTEKTVGNHKLTLEIANKIRKSIIEYQEHFTPHIFEDVVIVGGIRDRGHSEHDIDIVLLWNFEYSEDEELKHIKRILNHLVDFWLKKIYGDLVDYLDFYSYIRFRNGEYAGKLTLAYPKEGQIQTEEKKNA